MREPASGPTFAATAFSHCGSVRTHNEDNFYLNDHIGLWAVADGMGGHSAGDKASLTVVSHLAEHAETLDAANREQSLQTCLQTANATILQNMQEAAVKGGTTCALLSLVEEAFLVMWAGDSRVYRFDATRKTLHRLSKDHSEKQMLIDRGVMSEAEANSYKRKNVIMSAIGVHPIPKIESCSGHYQSQDIFLLATDGLTEYFSDDELQDVLNTSPSIDHAAHRLLTDSIMRGGRDNVTLVLIQSQ